MQSSFFASLTKFLLLAACECHLPGTIGGNSSGCDEMTGQCSCNSTWHIGGRLCDRCEENAWNTTDSLFSCKGELKISYCSRLVSSLETSRTKEKGRKREITGCSVSRPDSQL